MAASYVVSAQSRSVQPLGPTQAREVEIVGITTFPTRIYVEYPIGLKDWRDTQGKATLSVLAEQIEQQVSEGLATGGAYAQDVDENGLLVDYLDMVVKYTPTGPFRGDMSTIVRIPLEAFLAASDPFFFQVAANPANMLSAAYDNLVATANQ